MFEDSLKSIWKKVIRKEALSAWDWLVLYVNKLGFVGTGYAVVGIYYWIKYIGNGIDFNLLIATAMTVLFAQINLQFVTYWWKKAFHKLFPENIVIPFIDETIK